MKTKYIILTLIGSLALNAAGDPELTYETYLKKYNDKIEKQDKEYKQRADKQDKEYQEQINRYNKLLKDSELEALEETKKIKIQMDRYNKLLTIWEAQAKRQDAILSRKEALLLREEKSKK